MTEQGQATWRTEEGEPRFGVLKAIRNIADLGGEGNGRSAIVIENGSITDSWYTVDDDFGLSIGTVLIISTTTRHHKSGGSISSVTLAPIPF